MGRSIPNEWNNFGSGAWDFSVNAQNITNFWIDGVNRAKSFETLFTMGMRGSGDEPLVEGEDISLLENVVKVQRKILTDAFPNVSVESVPQMWCLCGCLGDVWNGWLMRPQIRKFRDSMKMVWTFRMMLHFFGRMTSA